MGRKWRRRGFIAAGLAALGLAAFFALALALLNPRLTRYVESPEFRAELEKQTAKGLHFPSGNYAPIQRTGLLSVATDSFRAQDGRKALTSLDAHGISARFNPLGVFLRRWQLEEVEVKRGEVGIQIYEPKPEPSPAKPWYHVFLPQRVYLKRVVCQPADVTWQMRGKKGGIFATRLVITPHGRDFEYRAAGGTLKNPLTPELAMRRTHLLITKKRFTLHDLELGGGSGVIHGRGSAGTRGDKAPDFTLDWEKMPVAPWLPESWQEFAGGTATGKLRWTGRDFTIETAQVDAALRVEGGRVRGAPWLQKLAAITQRPDLNHLEFEECAADFTWAKERGELKQIALEDKGKFRLEGAISFARDSLGGTLELGVHPDYLAWLPAAAEVFPRAHGGYRWTTVHLAGTPEAPRQDLSPRLLDALKDSPFAFLGATFRALGAWLRGD